MSRFTPIVLSATLIAVLSACGAHSSTETRAHPTTTGADARPNVSVWGDSLTVQAAPALEAEGRARHLDIKVSAYFGLAPCDVTTPVLKDVGRGIDAIVFAFSGNNLTPCMSRNGARLQGDQYFDAYRNDLGRLVRAARAKHLPVLIVGPPTFPPAQNHPDRSQLRSVLRSVADAFGARYADSVSALGGSGFTRTLPCLSDETTALGCSHGRIVVRSGNGIHFDASRRVPCAGHSTCTYSAGAHRFADVVLSALAQIPTLHVVAAPPASGVPIVGR